MPASDVRYFGNIELNAVPESDNHVTTKKYVDDSIKTLFEDLTKKELCYLSTGTIPITKTGEAFIYNIAEDPTIVLDTDDLEAEGDEIVEASIYLCGASTSTEINSMTNVTWSEGGAPSFGADQICEIKIRRISGFWFGEYTNFGMPTGAILVTTLSDATTHTGTSLRDAISNASAGSTIMFAPDLHGSIVLEQGELSINKTLTIDGHGRITIDGNNTYTCIKTSSSSASVVLKDLKITNGYNSTNSYGAGIDVASPITLISCDIIQNNGQKCGGLHLHSTVAAVLTGCTIRENTGYYAGGIYIDSNSSTATSITNCLIENNSASASTNAAGGVYCKTKALIIDSTIMGNTSADSYGGLYLYTFSDVTNCIIANNTGGIVGGAYINSYNTPFTDCVIRGNSGRTGGIYYASYSSSLVLTRCDIIDNSATTYAGGIYCAGPVTCNACKIMNNKTNTSGNYAGGVYTYNGTNTFTDCTISGNSGTKAPAGGVYLGGKGVFTNCMIANNSGKNGGLYSYSSGTTLTNCILNGNRGSQYAGSIYVYSTATITNCTIVNGIGGSAGGVYAASTTRIYNTGIFNCGISMTGYSSYINPQHCMSDNGTWADITYDPMKPLFESDGYTPCLGSQLVNAGDSSLCSATTDFLGNPRVDNEIIDIGAIEYIHPEIEGVTFTNSAPLSSPAILTEGAEYLVSSFLHVSGTQSGDVISYEIGGIVYDDTVPTISEPGEYHITVTVTRVGYLPIIQSFDCAVKMEMDATATTDKEYYIVGDTVIINIAAPTDATSAPDGVSCTINGTAYTATLLDGQASLSIPNLSQGTYRVYAAIEANNKYKKWTQSFDVDVASVLYVTTTTDATSHSGVSLRDAVQTAVSPCVIKFSVTGTILLQQGVISISKKLWIDGENKITITGNNTSRCIATSGSYKVTLLNLTIDRGYSDASNTGGGLTCSSTGGTIIKGCTISNCTTSGSTTAKSKAGGVYAYSTTIIEDCTFAANTGKEMTGSGNGAGALLVNAGSCAVRNTVFRNNTFTGNYGWTGNGSAGIVTTYLMSLDGCRFLSNSATSSMTSAYACCGGALFTTKALTISRCRFHSNTVTGSGTPSAAGAIRDDSPYGCRYNNCVFTSNTGTLDSSVTTTGNCAGAIYAGGGGDFVLVNCTFSGNSGKIGSSGGARTTVGAIICNGRATLHNTVFYQNGYNSYYSSYTPTVSHCISDDGVWADIAYDSSLPMFASDGYSPCAGSQLIDAGDSSLNTETIDFLGNPRVNGSAIDIGAIEYTP